MQRLSQPALSVSLSFQPPHTMAYNREWDRGKDGYDDSGAWNDYNSYNGNSGWNDNSYTRGNVRGREDEQYGDGKRRKYNNGGYDAPQYEDSGYDTGYGHGRKDWPQDNPQDKGYGKKRLVPSEPSPHVIFLGLDPDFTEADLQAYLTSNNCSVETVTIIRDRSTGVSKGFGFAQFASVEHARAFVDPLYPFIQVPPPASHGASASTAFYKALENGVPHNGRRVKIDYSQSASPGEKRRGPLNTNDGTRDIGNSQVPVLLFRGLDPLSGPQAISQAMKNSAGFGKEGAKGMKRIILIKDKVTMASWGFAFVEFVDVASASAVLGNTMSAQIHPNGFRISDRPVAASFAHPYSFQPLPDYSLRDDACIMSSLSMGGVEGVWVRYWDEASTIAMLEFKVEEPVQPAPAVKEKKEKRKAKGDLDEAKPVEASTLPVSDKPVTLNFKGGFGQKLGVAIASTSGPIKKPITVPTAFSLAVAAEEEEERREEEAKAAAAAASQDGDDVKAPTVKKVAPMVASKKTVNNITKWNQVQEELRDGTDAAAPVVPVPEPVVISEPKPQPKPKASTPVVEQEFEFSDTAAKTCLLCARQFKTLDQLKRHNNESDLHKRNFADAALRDIAREKVKAARAKASSSTTTTEQPKYRDRASERRIMHNQPDIPLPDITGNAKSSALKKRQAEGPPAPPSPPPPPLNPGQDENNVGNKLLRMMGWKEGTGLGTDGEGRVDPIETAIYAQGAGLGASKGKEVGKYADGYSGYVHMAKDSARERYEQ
ncbi:hypothetical protein BXZ70DRAFT_926798 [Cristinia sonorae]|uniref:RNA-binding protein n=1 Tax=Cristinia sonorae TaxID=1940300 RepID=A0A8K0XRQ9_9AGAR|nr:hypothetical protein BXZ70DRAFT_926798 [Cristinia sonorae]